MSPASSQDAHDATGWSRARGLPAPHEYTNRHVYGKYVQCSSSTSLSGLVSYFGFSGMGPPPKGLGQPGDIYVDVNPHAPELYALDVNLEWRAWSGPEVMHAHPTSDDWCLWAFAKCFGWFSPKDVQADRDSRGHLGRRRMIAQALECNNPQFCVDARTDRLEIAVSSTEPVPTPPTYLPSRPIIPITLKRLPPAHAFDTAERSKRAKHQDKDDVIEELSRQVALLQQEREVREQLDVLVPEFEKKREDAAQTELAKMHARIEIPETELANIKPRKSSLEEAIAKLPPHLLSLVEGTVAGFLEECESKARDIMLLRSAATVAAEDHAAATSAAEADYAAALSTVSKKAEHEKELAVKAAAELAEISAREKQAIQKGAAESLEAAANNMTYIQARADEEAAKRIEAERKLAVYENNMRAVVAAAGEHSLSVEPLAPIQL